MQERDESDRQLFQSQGVIVKRNFIARELIDNCLQALNDFDNFSKAIKDNNAIFDEKATGEKHLKYFQHINFYIPAFWKIINSAILNYAATLLNQEVYYCNLGLHNKTPGIGTLTPAHQDNYYWCLSPADALTAYIPLEKQDAENGGIQYYPATHLLGTLPHLPSKTKAFSSYIDHFISDQHQVFNPTLNPGDVAFHHCNLIHQASENHSLRQRPALAMTIYGMKTNVSKEMLEVYKKNLHFNREGKISVNITVD